MKLALAIFLFTSSLQAGGLLMDPIKARPAGDRSVTLAWNAPEGLVSGYRLHWQIGNRANVLETEETSATVNDLVRGVEYRFTVTAYNETQESVPSNEVSYTP